MNWNVTYFNNEAERRAQYAVCKIRGHQHNPNWAICQTETTQHYHCKFCGTEFWTETVLHERDAPEGT